MWNCTTKHIETNIFPFSFCSRMYKFMRGCFLSFFFFFSAIIYLLSWRVVIIGCRLTSFLLLSFRRAKNAASWYDILTTECAKYFKAHMQTKERTHIRWAQQAILFLEQNPLYLVTLLGLISFVWPCILEVAQLYFSLAAELADLSWWLHGSGVLLPSMRAVVWLPTTVAPFHWGLNSDMLWALGAEGVARGGGRTAVITSSKFLCTRDTWHETTSLLPP